MLTYLAFVLRKLPLSWALNFGKIMGCFWYDVLRLRRQQMHQNIQKAFGNLPQKRLQDIARQSCMHWAMYVVECLRIVDITPLWIQQHVVCHGLEKIKALFEENRKVLIITAHLGNIDLLGACLCHWGLPVHAVVKKIHSPAAQAYWTKIRQQSGLGCIPDKRSMPLIKNLLNHRQVVAFLIDQHLPAHQSIVCSLFDHRAATTPAPVKLAFEMEDVVLVPLVLVRKANLLQHHLYVEDPFTIQTPYEDRPSNIHHNTQRLNTVLEGWIRTWPEQWLWSHRRWKVEGHDDQSPPKATR